MAITGDYSIPLFRFNFESAQIGMYCGYGDTAFRCQLLGLTQSDQRTINTDHLIAQCCQVNGISPFALRKRQNLAFRNPAYYGYKKFIRSRSVGKTRFAVAFIPVCSGRGASVCMFFSIKTSFRTPARQTSHPPVRPQPR